MIVVQKITTMWTKESRSAPNAVKRNAVPRVLPLPPVSDSALNDNILQHNVFFSERNLFQSPSQRVELQPREYMRWYHFGCVHIHPRGPTVHVTFIYDSISAGAPERNSYPTDLMDLVPGQWGQIQYNGRFHGRFDNVGSWHYQHVVVNVAYLDTLQSDIFTTQPIKTFAALADLW